MFDSYIDLEQEDSMVFESDQKNVMLTRRAFSARCAFNLSKDLYSFFMNSPVSDLRTFCKGVSFPLMRGGCQACLEHQDPVELYSGGVWMKYPGGLVTAGRFEAGGSIRKGRSSSPSLKGVRPKSRSQLAHPSRSEAMRPGSEQSKVTRWHLLASYILVPREYEESGP